MIGIVVTTLAVLGTAVVGWFVHRLLASGKVTALADPPAPDGPPGRGGTVTAVWGGLRAHICVTIAVVAGLLTGMTAYGALRLVRHWIPAFDDPDFYRTSVAADVRQATPGLVIELVYNPASPVRRDFVVKVRVVRSPLGFGPGHYFAGLTGSRIVEIRDDHACPVAPDAPADARHVVSCTEIAGDPDALIFRWDVTPVESGQSNLSLRFDGDWLPPAIDASSSPTTLSINGQSFDLSPGRSEYEFGAVGLDLGSRLMRFPVEVQTSLGLSQSTYDAIMLFVGLAGCLLGSGWLFRFVGRREKKAAA